ncbi:MAG: phage major capsid protein [Gemmatimonadota bacterium]|nr:phage major capsid protein [Gemmatimonadota bacterium]MDE2864095.1 phage major capsid protein [Gemmatimonadota bacterium]
MTPAQRYTLEASRLREQINEELSAETPDDEKLATLQAEFRSAEKRRRIAIEAEDEGVTTPHGADAEERARRELREKASVADFVTAALTGQGVKGASAEYADAVGTPGLMPLDLLEAPEERAVTPGPADETVTATRPTVPHAFARTDAAALGINMPMVSPGEAHFPALTTAPPAGPKAKDAAAASTAAAFSLTKRTPGRITGQFLVRLEDLALFPSMESDLRRGIGGAMADNLDEQVIDGDGSSPNLSGLFHQATDVAKAGAVETFATGVSRFAGLIDGKHANGWGDVRALIGTDTFALYAGLFHGNSGEMSLYDYLAGKLGGLRVSTRVPDKAASAQKGIAVLGAQGQPITLPVWKGVELIVDPYTQAAKGQRVITAVTLVGSPFIPYGTSQVVEIHPKLS